MSVSGRSTPTEQLKSAMAAVPVGGGNATASEPLTATEDREVVRAWVAARPDAPIVTGGDLGVDSFLVEGGSDLRAGDGEFRDNTRILAWHQIINDVDGAFVDDKMVFEAQLGEGVLWREDSDMSVFVDQDNGPAITGVGFVHYRELE